MSRKQVFLRSFSCCKVIVELWPGKKKKFWQGEQLLQKKISSTDIFTELPSGMHSHVPLCHTNTAFVCAIPLHPKADARSLTVTLRSCVISFPSLCHMHKHGLQALCVKLRREIGDTWCEGYAASKIVGQHFIGVRDSKVKRQKKWY